MTEYLVSTCLHGVEINSTSEARYFAYVKTSACTFLAASCKPGKVDTDPAIIRDKSRMIWFDICMNLTQILRTSCWSSETTGPGLCHFVL